MKLTKSAQKDHGPCLYCPEPILKGQSYYTALRPPGEGQQATWAGCVTVKFHAECRFRLREVQQLNRALLRLWRGWIPVSSEPSSTSSASEPSVGGETCR